jgi:hypothetical protein
VSWTDKAGIFWLFGGLGFDANGRSVYLNDLWKYSAGEWTWMGGSKVATLNQSGFYESQGVYGTQGTAAPGNIPGGRSGAVSWTDIDGNLWLFGGGGNDSNGTEGNLNDLWEYSSGQWTWVSGSNVIDQPGVYGTEGTAAADNVPSARYYAVGWTDVEGNLWLFGGSSGTGGTWAPLNDLWKYKAGQWTWMSGSNAPFQNGIYGTQGVAASENTPGARLSSATWTDSSGNLWLFAGDGFDSAGNLDVDDLWKYNAGQWTWVDGPKLGTESAIYGTQGTAASGNMPGARLQAVTWQDSSGNLWLFGGNGYDSNKTFGYLNDLWKYEP